MSECCPLRSLGSLIEARVIDATTGFPCGSHNDAGIGVPHIRPFNVGTNGEISLQQVKSVANEAAEGKPRLRRNDILFNNTNTKELVGKCALWDLDFEPVFSNHMTRIRVVDPACEPAYLSFAILHHWATGHSQMLARSHVAQASIIGERFREIEVPWRSSSDQRALSIVLCEVRKACRSELRQAEHALQVKQAAMRELFTRGLRGEPQKETEFAPVPDSWEVMPLDAVAIVQTGIAKGRRLDRRNSIEVPYLRVANVQDGHLDLREVKTIPIRLSELERYLLRDGDVVLTEGGDFDKLGRGFIWRGEILNCVHQNHVFAVRVDRERLLPEFVAYLVQSAYGKAYFLKVAHKTTNLACINTTKLKALPTLVPGIDEQREIVSIVDAIDRKIDLHRRKHALLENLFKSLLHKLMTGEVRVSDLDLSALPAAGGPSPGDGMA